VTLSANQNYWQGSPYIQTIQVNYLPTVLYYSSGAPRRGDGLCQDESNNAQMSDSKVFSYNLPRELDLFFNLSKQICKM